MNSLLKTIYNAKKSEEEEDGKIEEMKKKFYSVLEKIPEFVNSFLDSKSHIAINAALSVLNVARKNGIEFDQNIGGLIGPGFITPYVN